MKILFVSKYLPIQGGVSVEAFWTANALAELGHQVHVLTNAEEVEDAYKVVLSADDTPLLRGFRNRDAVALTSTTTDRKHVYVPRGNPSVSKLIGLGIDIVRDFKPDFILGWYLEPYGVVAMVLSQLTGVPYAVRHAGSDIGRLMLTDQLRPTYCAVLQKCFALITAPRHHERFEGIGVSSTKFIRPVSLRLPGDVFFPAMEQSEDENALLIYGKVGESKGSLQAAEAVIKLRNEGSIVVLKAHWGGRDLEGLQKEIGGLGRQASEAIKIMPLLPHWRLADEIRKARLVLFLENRFRISFHTPGVPFEAWACGKHLITTEEIADKPHIAPYLSQENTTIVSGNVTADSIALAIRDGLSKRKADPGKAYFDAGIHGIRTRHDLQGLFSRLFEMLPQGKSA